MHYRQILFVIWPFVLVHAGQLLTGTRDEWGGLAANGQSSYVPLIIDCATKRLFQSSAFTMQESGPKQHEITADEK